MISGQISIFKIKNPFLNKNFNLKLFSTKKRFWTQFWFLTKHSISNFFFNFRLLISGLFILFLLKKFQKYDLLYKLNNMQFCVRTFLLIKFLEIYKFMFLQKIFIEKYNFLTKNVKNLFLYFKFSIKIIKIIVRFKIHISSYY